MHPLQLGINGPGMVQRGPCECGPMDGLAIPMGEGGLLRVMLDDLGKLNNF